MTNRQTQTTPGQALLTLAALLGGLGALGVAVWFIVTTDGPWDALGAIAWVFIAKSLMDTGVSRVLALGKAVQAEAQRQADNTGVWRAHEAGTMTVRFEPLTGVYWLSGWIDRDHELTAEVAYASAAGVCSIVEEAEAEGMVPDDDEATRAVRARLQVKGWDA